MYRLKCVGLFDRVLEFLALDEDLQASLTDNGKKVDDSRTKKKQQSFINSFIITPLFAEQVSGLVSI